MAEQYDPIEEFELTFRHGERTFSLSCDLGMIDELLKRIRSEEGLTGKDYPRRQFMAEIHNDELIGEHSDSVAAFLQDHESEWELTSDDGEIMDIEVSF